jgi:hypothetical protein
MGKVGGTHTQAHAQELRALRVSKALTAGGGGSQLHNEYLYYGL